MARQFVMSMYANKEDLYKAKAEYWESMAHETLVALFTSVNGRFPDEDEISGLVDDAEKVLIKHNLI